MRPPTLLHSVACAQGSPRRTDNYAASKLVEPAAPEPLPTVPYIEVSARQVFDVQWSFSGKELNALEFKRPAGTGPSGGFIRPVVDQDKDYYRLLVADGYEGQFQLRHYDEYGALKHQLTTHGQIKAISKEVILYSGDVQYGTLITLRKRYKYGTSAKFSGLVTTPSVEHLLEVFKAVRAERFRGASPSSGDSGCSSPEVSPLNEASRKCSSDSLCEDLRSTNRVKFNPRVSTILQRNMREVAPARKADVWWTQEDFAEFLTVRVQIGKVYRKAARQMGVDILKVSSEGSLRVEGYMQMVKEFPELAQESRRGLGLGRKKERARNRDAYIAGVLKEQKRQHSVWHHGFEAASACTSGTEEASASEASDSEELEDSRPREPVLADRTPVREKLKEGQLKLNAELPDEGRPRGDSSEAATTVPNSPRGCSTCSTPSYPQRPFVVDDEALARVATAISKKDRDYAHFLAKTYYEQDRIEMAPPVSRGNDEAVQKDFRDTASGFGSGDKASSPRSTRRLQRKASEDYDASPLDDAQEDNSDLKDEDEEDVGIGRKEATFSKGYGLSRQKLLEVGLSATGHAVSRSLRARGADWSPSSDGESDPESGMEEGASDWEA